MLNLPVSALISSQSASGLRRDKGAAFDPSKIVLDLSNLRECLTRTHPGRDSPIISVDQIYPVVSTISAAQSEGSDDMVGSGSDESELPVLIRERDVAYQFCRVTLYKRLLR